MEFLCVDSDAELQRATPTLLSFLHLLSSAHTLLLSLDPRKEMTHYLLCTDDVENPSIGNDFHT